MQYLAQSFHSKKVFVLIPDWSPFYTYCWVVNMFLMLCVWGLIFLAKPRLSGNLCRYLSVKWLCVWCSLKKTIMQNHGNTQTQFSFITQNGPVRMSSPVSTGILKFCGQGAASALGAPPVRSWSDIVAPRFPTLCKRCASFRTTN